MTFLEAIEPHNERLDFYQKSKNFSGDVNHLRALANIYLEFVYQGKGDVKPNLGCNDCKSKMMQRILTHRDMCLNTNGGEIKKASNSIITIEETGTYELSLGGENYDSMKMGELKSIASKKGMNTYRKTKQQIIEWLKENKDV